MTQFDAEQLRWAKRQAKQSLRLLEYWQTLAARLWQDRQTYAPHNTPNVPIGRHSFGLSTDLDPQASGLLVSRNLQAIELEKAGNIELAMFLFELNLADEFSGSIPSDRLRILYARQKNYIDAIRVCQTYLATLDRIERRWPTYPNLRERPTLQAHIQKLQARLSK